jgi:hypothetical protein
MMIHTRPSTWIAVLSVLITAFAALPTWPSFFIHVANIGVLIVLVWAARHEGKQHA